MVTPAPSALLFDPARIRAQRRRAAARFDNHDFLFHWAAKNMKGRLTDIKRTFQKVLHIGYRGHTEFKDSFSSYFYQDLNIPDVEETGLYTIATPEYMPFTDASFDLILSTLELHSINDLPGALVQIRKCLKPDGVFLAAMLGGETLHELRASLMAAELECKGGASPRVSPFADKRQMGDLLQRTDFALPVVDSSILTVTYSDMFKLMHDVRYMGEGNAITARNRLNPGKEFFAKAAQHYTRNFSDNDGRIRASFEIIFLLGWAPHETQPKPLKPGSALNKLADALRTQETTSS